MKQHPHHRGTGKRREKGIENLFEETITENFPKLVKEKSPTRSGSTESLNQDKPKQTHTNTL